MPSIVDWGLGKGTKERHPFVGLNLDLSKCSLDVEEGGILPLIVALLEGTRASSSAKVSTPIGTGLEGSMQSVESPSGSPYHAPPH